MDQLMQKYKIIEFNEAKETLLFLFQLFRKSFSIIPTSNSLQL
jgi:hypothetical protein